MKTYKPVEEKTNSELEICFNLNGYLDKILKYKYDFIMREREGIVSDEGILMRKSMGPRGKRPQARGGEKAGAPLLQMPGALHKLLAL